MKDEGRTRKAGTGRISHKLADVVAEIDDVAAKVAGCYDQMTPACQVATIKLGYSLSLIRQRCQDKLLAKTIRPV